jgi:CheY-like chemotaxis protein/anti-sigma regulatory factor (Ser/Thr protein kinase)
MQFAELVSDIASLFELEALAKGLAFRCDITGVLPPVVRADEKRVRQILINLLGNAIKFTTQGQVVMRVRYAREMAVIDIEDTGPGMTAQELGCIFEPFTRLNSSGHYAAGAGMGLTIAKMLTDLMGGEMTVTSTPGLGSVFRVKLFLPEVRMPLSVTVYSPASKHQNRFFVRRPRVAYVGPRRHILVVDNEAADRELLNQLLQPIGFEVRTAASGHDCLDLLAAGLQPEVILMDLAMPGIDGWETIRRVRDMWRSNPGPMPHIAIVSANAFDRGMENDVGIPSEDFILKPVRHTDLLDWLEQRLHLTWLETSPPIAPPAAVPLQALVFPELKHLQSLLEMVNLGYYRGILNQLDTLEAALPSCLPFVTHMRDLARQFQFETMREELAQATVPGLIRDPGRPGSWIADQVRKDNL